MIQRVEFYMYGTVRFSPATICLLTKKVEGDHSSRHSIRYMTAQRRLHDQSVILRIVSYDGLTTDVKYQVSFKKENLKYYDNRVLESPKMLSKGLTVIHCEAHYVWS
jgi:hypothetical protein